MKLLAESFALQGLEPRSQNTATQFFARKSASAREQLARPGVLFGLGRVAVALERGCGRRACFS